MTATVTDTKICGYRRCGRKFERGPTVSRTNWDRKQYCRDACTQNAAADRREVLAFQRSLEVPLLGVRPRDVRWRTRAACLNEDPELFYPVSDKATGQIAKAKRVCAGCPVRAECLAEAVAHGDDDGIFGGTTASERRAAQRRKTRAS